MAIACNPSMLIADEPTTALDVTTQAQILDLMQNMQRELGMAVMLITHDLGVVAEMADDVAVMYLGRVAESADVDTIFHDAQAPLHQGPAALHPARRGRRARAAELDPGHGARPFNRPSGCVFHPAATNSRGRLRRAKRPN